MSNKSIVGARVLSLLALASIGTTYSEPIQAAPGDALSAPVPIIDVVPANSGARLPEVTIDQGGQIVVGWERGVNPGTLALRRFTPDLTAAAGSSVVDPSSLEPDQDSPRSFVGVATNAIGQTVVAYITRSDEIVSQQALFVRRYRRDGGSLGDPQLVAVQNLIQRPRLSNAIPRIRTGRTGGHPAVTINAAGDFVVAWTESESSGVLVGPRALTAYRSRVMARRYFADGTPVGSAVRIAERGPEPFLRSNQLEPDVRVVAMTDDRFAVVYSGGFGEGLFPFTLQFIDRDGQQQGLPIRLPINGDRALSVSDADFHAALTPNGELLLTWVADSVASGFDRPEQVWIRRYSLTGRPLGSPASVAVKRRAGRCCTVRAVPMANGAVAVIWSDFSSGFQILGRYYAADLSPLTEPFLLVNGTTDASAVADASGNLIVAYGTLDTMPQPRQLYLQRFQGP